MRALSLTTWKDECLAGTVLSLFLSITSPVFDAMPYGYNGKRLIVDLSEGKVTIKKPEETWYRTYIGGMGSVAYHLLKNIAPGTDPLDIGNVLVMSTGARAYLAFNKSGNSIYTLQVIL